MSMSCSRPTSSSCRVVQKVLRRWFSAHRGGSPPKMTARDSTSTSCRRNRSWRVPNLRSRFAQGQFPCIAQHPTHRCDQAQHSHHEVATSPGVASTCSAPCLAPVGPRVHSAESARRCLRRAEDEHPLGAVEAVVVLGLASGPGDRDPRVRTVDDPGADDLLVRGAGWVDADARAVTAVGAIPQRNLFLRAATHFIRLAPVPGAPLLIQSEELPALLRLAEQARLRPPQPSTNIERGARGIEWFYRELTEPGMEAEAPQQARCPRLRIRRVHNPTADAS